MYHKYATLRDERGLTDYEVAKRIGANPSLFSDWKKRCEAGRTDSTLKFDYMVKVADVLDVPVTVFAKEDP